MAPRSSPLLIYLIFLASRTSETDGQFPRNMFLRCGLLCSSVAPFPVSSLSCHRSDTRWSVLWRATVPVSSSFSGSLLDSPFSISDSPLVGLRPFSLPLFQLCCAAQLCFVVLRCLLWYWLGFYLKWQHMTTVSPSWAYNNSNLFTLIICSWSIFTKSNRLSILVANFQL